jgi:protein-S-isoprenylcysteine O-methyltransferase Ste14
MFGWLIHWPTVLTLILFPILVCVYYWLAIKEEKGLDEVFGTEYEKYKVRTPLFFPLLTRRKSSEVAS